MRRLLTVALVAITTTSLATFARAEDSLQDRKAAAIDLLVASDTPLVLEQSIATSLDAQIKANPAIAKFRPVILEFLNKHMSWDSLKDDFAKIYAEAFTLSELREIEAFYKTPIGKKLAKNTPALMAQGMELGQKRVQDNISELQEAIRKEAQKGQ
jgi:hypothetical protein